MSIAPLEWILRKLTRDDSLRSREDILEAAVNREVRDVSVVFSHGQTKHVKWTPTVQRGWVDARTYIMQVGTYVLGKQRDEPFGVRTRLGRYVVSDHFDYTRLQNELTAAIQSEEELLVQLDSLGILKEMRVEAALVYETMREKFDYQVNLLPRIADRLNQMKVVAVKEGVLHADTGHNYDGKKVLQSGRTIDPQYANRRMMGKS